MALWTGRRYLNATLFQRDAQVGSGKEEDQAGCTQTRKVVEVTWEGLRVVVAAVVVMASLHCQVGWT